MRRPNLLIVTALPVLLLGYGTALAQVPGRGGIGGARVGGTGGLSSPRSGLGVRNHPVVNPSPSLTPSQVLNPRASLNTGQVLNPKGSLNRPRTGVTSPTAKDSNSKTRGSTAGPRHQAARPAVGDGTTGSVNAGSVNAGAVNAGSVNAGPVNAGSVNAGAPAALPAGEQILEAVVVLDNKLTKVAPDKGWSERLSLDDLRAVPVFSEHPADDGTRTELEKILKAYQAVAKEKQSADISQLPEFKATLSALQAYLSPPEVRLRQKAASSFQQLANDLRLHTNGAPWVAYLVPAEMTATDNTVTPSKEQADKLLKRFDKLAANPDYKKVTTLPGFKPAYDALKATVRAAK